LAVANYREHYGSYPPAFVAGPDGRPWHSRVADFENDRVRDRRAAAHGFATLRFTHADLTRPAAVTAAEILAVFRSYAPTSHRLAG